MYGKLKNGKLVIDNFITVTATEKITVKKVVYNEKIEKNEIVEEIVEKTKDINISNPTNEQYKSAGYKEIIYSEKPTLTDAQKLSESYEESDTQITVNYATVDKTYDEIKAETTAKIVELERAYMLPRYLRQLILADTTIADTADIKIKAKEIEVLAESLRITI